MNITIIGAGNVGSALAKSLSRAGHTILIGARQPASRTLTALIEENRGISAHPISEAVKSAEVIIISTPPTAIQEVSHNMGKVEDKIIIDTTNSLFSKPLPFENCSEALRKLTGSQHVVKCFNTTGFENMENPIYQGEGVDMFVAGNSTKAKEIASRLAGDIGFSRCHDFGGDDKIPLLEHLAMCWINLAILQKQGRDIAFKVVKR